MKAALRNLISRIPGLRFWVARRIFLGPTGNTHRFWGVFPTMAEARRHIPSGYDKGFEAPDPSGNFEEKIPERDNELVRILRVLVPEARSLFDFGGNVGVSFYQYRATIASPPGFRWIVCDVPAVCEAGRRIASERDAKQLEFVTDQRAADCVDIYLTSGALQYLEEPLADQLAKLKLKPRHVLVNRVPLTDKPAFYTLQNMGLSVVPYHLFNRAEFISSMEALGYKLVEKWANDRFCEIILRPEYFVPHYYGFYFQKAD